MDEAMTKMYAVLDLNKLDLMSQGLTTDEVSALTPEDMEKITNEIRSELIDAFYNVTSIIARQYVEEMDKKERRTDGNSNGV